MLAYLVLTVVASASAIPSGEKSILPIWEVPLVFNSDAGLALKSWCVDDCHRHVLEKPVFLMKKLDDGKRSIRYYPQGLNSLGGSTQLMKKIMTGKMVAIITPLAKFPYESFPDVANMIITNPEYNYKFADFYKEAPVMIFLSEEEFTEFSKVQKGFTHLADLVVDGETFSVSKEYPLTRSERAVDAKEFWEGLTPCFPFCFPSG